MSIIYKPKALIVNERYEIIRLLGEGGAGTVYQARNKQTIKDVAIKVLHQELIEDSKQVEIFKYEAQLATRLDHPNIVKIHETATDQQYGKTIYLLVMEYLAGGSLAAKITSSISIRQAIDWIKQLLNAVTYAHDKGIIHQDIKSANVFLTSNGKVKIGDFGLARLADAPYSENTAVPFAKDLFIPQKKGSPAYMSPELCYGEIQDERSDIYSLGVLFYELLTGQLPFQAEGMIALARQHTSQPVPSIIRLNPGVPSILDDVVKRMMAKEKDTRYQSAHQILDVIRDL